MYYYSNITFMNLTFMISMFDHTENPQYDFTYDLLA